MIGFIEGFLAGIAGALPFVHVNLVLKLFPALPQGLELAQFAAALTFSHLAFSLLPTLLLFIPTGAQATAILPFRSFAPGKVIEVAAGTLLLALLASIALLPLLAPLLPLAFAWAKPQMPWLLPALILLFFASERSLEDAANGAMVFLLSGLLGAVVLDLPNLPDPLFPLLSGLFAVPALLAARQSPQARAAQAGIPKPEWRLVLAGVLAGAFSTLFPALSPGVLAGACLLFFEGRPERFLALSASIASSKAFYDFIAALQVGKARNAVAVQVLPLAKDLPADALMPAVVLASLASCALAVFVVLRFQKPARRVLEKLPEMPFRLCLLGALAALSFSFDGLAGLAVLVAAGTAGALALLLKTRRAHLVGALLVPTMLYFLGVAL